MGKIEFAIDYLTFDQDFEITYNDESIVIYGSNGMGKTSIYNAIRSAYTQFDYIDYSDMKFLFINGKSKELNVTPHAQQYNDLQQLKELKSNELSASDILKRYDVNSVGKASISSRLSTIQKGKRIVEKITIDKEKHIELSGLSDNEVKFLLKNLENLKKISNINEDIKVLKDEYINEVLVHLDKTLEDGCCICPVCDSEVPQLRKIIVEKIKAIKKINTNLLEEFRTENKGIKNDVIIIKFEKLLSLSSKVTEKEIIDYMFVPEFEKIKEINSALTEVEKIDVEIKLVKADMIQSYQNLKNSKDLYITYINKKFNVDVKFDDNNYTVKVKLERHPKEYSTGEFNLILFTTKIFEFVGSDKKLMVLDDPISSYDIINQYKIAFDIVSNNKQGVKNFLIFTHNMNLINLLNTQQRGIFKFKMLDKIDGVIHVYDYNVFARDSIMSIDKLLENVEGTEYTKYIQLAMERDNIKVEKGTQDMIHKLFHYDDFYEFPLTDHPFYENDLTNQKLIEIVDGMEIDNFDKNDYCKLVIYKIILMIGLRVWIEKKLYDVLNSDPSYTKRESLADKISYALPSDGANRVISHYPNLLRTDLMSRKVMLNQHEHYRSQGEPFYYVMNLSVDDIFTEINEVKELFD